MSGGGWRTARGIGARKGPAKAPQKAREGPAKGLRKARRARKRRGGPAKGPAKGAQKAPQRPRKGPQATLTPGLFGGPQRPAKARKGDTGKTLVTWTVNLVNDGRRGRGGERGRW